MRVKSQYRSDRKEVYERFIKEYPEYNISFKEWRKILYIINKSIRGYLFETGNKFRVPHGFGDLFVNKKKSKKTYTDKDGNTKISLPVDWIKTRKKGKKDYILNDHTEGYRFGIMYAYRYSKLNLRKLWKFSACRGTYRLLAKYIKDKDRDYQYK